MTHVWGQKDIDRVVKLRFLILFGILVSFSTQSADWVASNLQNSKKVGTVNGSPVLICAYRVGDGDYSFSIHVAREECPNVVFYSIEINKWAAEHPLDYKYNYQYRF